MISDAKAAPAGSNLRQANRPYRNRIAVACLFALLACAGTGAPTTADAAPKAVVGSFGTPNGEKGGQLAPVNRNGVAVNRSGVGAPEGSVYVAEGASNHRISQFSAEGSFLRTWGFDVVDGVNFPLAPNDNGTGFEICDVTNGNTAEECKRGVTGGAAGQLANPVGIAVDQATGHLYVASLGNRRVDVFSGEGDFVGAFGYDVLPADPNPSGPDFCTAATGCQPAAAAGAQAGRFSNLTASIPAIDPNVSGRVYVADQGNLRVNQYTVTTAGGAITAVSFDKAFGWDVIPANATTTLESCTILTTCQAGSAGNGAGQFTAAGSPSAVAVDGTGAIYVTSGPLNGGIFNQCSAAAPCRVQKFAPDASSAADFGPSEGEGQLRFAAGSPSNVAAINLAVDPASGHVLVLKKEAATGYRVYEYDSTGTYLDRHPGTSSLDAPSSATQNTGLGIGTDERLYVNYGANAGAVLMLGPVPPAQPQLTPPVEGLTETGATVNGTVTIAPPGGPGFEAAYSFELSTNGVGWKTVSEGTTGSEVGSHPVSASISNLQPNTQYLVRLSATTGPKVESAPLEFTTLQAAPSILDVYPAEVNEVSTDLSAHIDPEGLKTSYHVEWGPTESYGNRVPAFERQIGAGNKTVIVAEEIDGLMPGTVYNFRVVAENAAGTTVSGNARLETLNSCGLTVGRCTEMVSPADKGPVGAAGDTAILGINLQFQAHRSEPALAYSVAYGLPDSTSGSEVLYESKRGASGWSSRQLAPAHSIISPGGGQVYSNSSFPLGLSADLSCEVLASNQPLSANAPQEALEQGKGILFVRSEAGGYSAITTRTPQNLPPKSSIEAFDLIGISDAPGHKCDRAYFSTEFQYPGVSGTGTGRLYEWDGDALSHVGVVPGPSGDVEVEATGGAVGGFNWTDAVSRDGSQIVFSATRQASVLPAEIGRTAVFVRRDGVTAVDASKSQSGTPNDGPSRYELASDDGRYVFFTARYGLDPAGSSAGTTACAVNETGTANGPGCDLYRYDVESGELLDLSVPGDASNPGGAGVAGVLGASDDGTKVYFAARGQLVPGEGVTEPANLAAGTYTVYLWADGDVRVVGQIQDALKVTSIFTARSTAKTEPRFTSRVTPTGDALLFESRASVTDYDSQGKAEAYLYDAGAETVVCVSCRRDGSASVDPELWEPLASPYNISNPLAPPASLTEDGEMAFFISQNRLAPGATEGRPNLYQWREGQVTFIGSSEPNTTTKDLRFAGASADGDELYFTTVDQLTWQDTDGKLDVYNARVGGGVPEPPAPPDSCDPEGEGSCQNQGVGAPVPPAPASAGQPGAGNLESAAATRGCLREARLAKRLANRAKRLRGRARAAKRRSLSRAGGLSRKAGRLARRAKGLSAQARRCRQQANDNRRAGK